MLADSKSGPCACGLCNDSERGLSTMCQAHHLPQKPGSDFFYLTLQSRVIALDLHQRINETIVSPEVSQVRQISLD